MQFKLKKILIDENIKVLSLYKEKRDSECPILMNGGNCINEGFCYPEGEDQPNFNCQ